MSRREATLNGTEASYKRKFRWVSFCVYCGEHANTHDHVLPLSVANALDLRRSGVRSELFQGLNKVPCCLECNVLAGNKSFISILEKRRYIQRKLKQRYKKVLRAIMWDEEELAEMGYSLRVDILGTLSKRSIMESRVMWPVLSLRKNHT